MQQNKKNVILKDYKKLCRLYEAGTIFTAVDTETTSITPSTGRVMEIGAVRFSKDGILAEYNQLINPQTVITPFITNLTHITQNMVDAAPLMEEKLQDFLSFLGTSLIVGHNIRFDLNFLNSECQLCHCEKIHNKLIDTLQLSRQIFPELEKHKLEFLADNLGLNKGSSHRAFDDAECCRQLFILCLQKYKVTN